VNRLTCLDDYFSIVKTAKKARKATVSNCFLFPDAVQRYIELDRLYYEEMEAGLILYSDEESYYQGYFFLNPDVSLHIAPKEKTIVLQNMWSGKEKSAKLLTIEKRLDETGFVYVDTMQQIQKTYTEPSAKTKRLREYARLALEKEGFVLRRITEEDFPSVRKLLAETPEIPYYSIAYFTTQELIQHCEAGLVVGIFDSEGELCAVDRCFPEGKTAYGWIAVKDKYKKVYGMALVLGEYMSGVIKQNGYNLSGWIDLKNTPSINYHTRNQYQLINRYVDHWLLESKASGAE